MLRISYLATAALAAAALGCVTLPAVDPGVHVRPETRPECVSACNQLGMDLGAVVLIRNAAGCVCQERAGQAPMATTPGATAVAGGAYLVALEEQKRREEEEEAQRRAQQSTPPPGTPGTPGLSPGSLGHP